MPHLAKGKASESQTAQCSPYLVGFEQADVDADGDVNFEEFGYRMFETFFLLDANGDGFLVIAEIDGVALESFERADDDSDGRVSVSEFIMVRAIEFRQADRNKDGELSRSEADAASGGQTGVL